MWNEGRGKSLEGSRQHTPACVSSVAGQSQPRLGSRAVCPGPALLTTAESVLTWSRVFKDEVLIIELLSVDGLAPRAVVVCEVTALAHELGDDAVEAASLEAKALFMGAQATEVLWCGKRERC